MREDPAESLLTPAELAARWKVTRKRLAEWRCEGRGPAFIKLGSGQTAPVRYRLAAVEAFEKKHDHNQEEVAPCDS